MMFTVERNVALVLPEMLSDPTSAGNTERVTEGWASYLRSATPSSVQWQLWVPGLLGSCHIVALQAVAGVFTGQSALINDLLAKRQSLQVARCRWA
ncbi:MAG: hypothetical protein ACKPKO_17220 [Candidatus Fonsibacter sp.]